MLIVEKIIRVGGITDESPLLGYLVRGNKVRYKDGVSIDSTIMDREVFIGDPLVYKYNTIHGLGFLFCDELAMVVSTGEDCGRVSLPNGEVVCIDYNVCMMYAMTINGKNCIARNVFKPIVPCLIAEDVLKMKMSGMPERLKKVKKILQWGRC